MVIQDATSGRDTLAKSQDGFRQDARVRDPDRGAARPRRHEAPRRADPGAHARARAAGEGRPRRHRARQAPARPRSCTAARASREQSKGVGDAHILDRDAGPARRISPTAGWSSWTACRSSCSTRRTACSTWGSSRRSTASSGCCRRIARRCSSPPRSTVRSAASPRSTRTNPVRHEIESRRQDGGGGGPSVRAGGLAREARQADRARQRGRSGLTLVFVNTKRRVDSLARQLRSAGRADRDDARRHDAAGAREGAAAVRGQARRRAGRDRRRRARPRPRRHHARRELRPSARRQGIRAPRRSDGARRTRRARASRSSRRTSRATSAAWRRGSTCTRSSSRRA